MSHKPFIGFIGLGAMGRGIASNLLKAGYSLGFLQRTHKASQDDVIALGAKSISNLSELVKNSEIIFLCLTGTPQIEEVMLGDSGVIAKLSPGTTIIDLSTAIPESTLRIAHLVEQAGGFYFDSPMTRTPKEAMEGRLNLLIGGDKELLERCRPILECFAENILYAGPISSGHRLKLIHNFVALGFSGVLAEAVACANLGKIDPTVLIQVLDTGAGNGVILNRMKGFIEKQDDSSFQFSIENALKDLGYYTSMVTEMGAYATAAHATKSTYEIANQNGGQGATVPQLIRLLNPQAD
jgi:3-hydroxyisobutyrate dehydrogenase